MRQAYGPPPPESKTISAIERKGTRPEHRGAAPERQKRQERHAGEIIPPAPPCFRRWLRPRRGGSVQAKRVAQDDGSSERLGLRGGDALGGRCSVCGLSAGVRCCAHLRWPTPVRQKVGQSCQRMGFPDVFWENIEGSFVNADRKVFSHPPQPRRYGESARYVGGNTEVRATGKPELVFSTLGARDLPSGGRADGGK